jgi:hypothetical protein
MYFFPGIPTPLPFRLTRYSVQWVGEDNERSIRPRLLSIRHHNEPPLLQTTKQREVCVYCGEFVNSTRSCHRRSPLDMWVSEQLMELGALASCHRRFPCRINPLKVPVVNTSTIKFNSKRKFYVLPTQCIYVFCVDLRTNSHYFTVQH